MGKLTSKLKQIISPRITTWETQAGNLNTSQKVNIYFCIPECIATKIVSWKYHVDKKTNSRYDMILGIDLLTTLGLNLKFSGNIIIGGVGPYEGCSSPMVELSNYEFKSLMENIAKTEEYFINLYINKYPKSESSISSMHIVHRILEDKYEKDNLNKIITEQCQHLSPSE